MALCRVMNTWVSVTLIALLASVRAGSHPSSYDPVSHGGTNGDNPLGRHWDWKLPLSNGMRRLSVIAHLSPDLPILLLRHQDSTPILGLSITHLSRRIFTLPSYGGL